MRKSPKAKNVEALLRKGMTTKEITSRMAVSPSYIWTIKKKMEQNDDNEARPRVVAPHKVMRVTKAQQEAIKEIAYQATLGRKGREAAAANSVSDSTNVDAILDERGGQYGSFMFSANIAIRLKGIMHSAIAQKDLHLAPDQMLALDMIAVKISRILSGNPSHKDSWVDIAGYAQLVADRLQGKER